MRSLKGLFLILAYSLCLSITLLTAKARTLDLIHSFEVRKHGTHPTGIIAVSGIQYGMTVDGGSGTNCSGSGYLFCGTVFSLNPATGIHRVIYSFLGGSDGAYPIGNLISASGMLYGATESGGAGCGGSGCGTLFSVNLTTGAKRTFYSFAGGDDGSVPVGSLIKVGGALFGTTTNGGGSGCGGNGCGTVFSVNPTTGAETVLYSFSGGSDGAIPLAGVISVGKLLYGTTYAGGVANAGTVFSLDITTHSERVIYAFTRGSDGAGPEAGLLDVSGILYGTTNQGGTGDGVVFAVNPTTGVESVIHQFGGKRNGDGSFPNALTRVGDVLFGTTQGSGAPHRCGAIGCGTIFKINLKNSV
jgi:uncharacterized repeat protein (TIGR03803 family)